MMSRSRSIDPASIPNRELAVYALAMVGGNIRRVHTEDIAIRAHQLFPGSFSWTMHPEIPDKDIVRVALTDARKEEFGALVDGRAGARRGQTARTKRDPVPDGWILTEAGIEFLKQRETDISQLAESTDQKDHRQVARRDMRRFKEHPLYAEFRRDVDAFQPSIGQLADILRCRVDADPNVWNSRIGKLRRISVEVEDDEFSGFVAKLESAYDRER